MTIIKAEDMHCEKCVERITKAMTDAGLDFQVSLADKTVSIDGCDSCVKKALEILDDLGFEGIVQKEGCTKDKYQEEAGTCLLQIWGIV